MLEVKKRRSEAAYIAAIRAVLEREHQPGDRLEVIKVYKEKVKCEMCGGVVDIFTCYKLWNHRTRRAIICGRYCIVNCVIVLDQMGRPTQIVFPGSYDQFANYVNAIRPNTAIVDPSRLTEEEDYWETKGIEEYAKWEEDQESNRVRMNHNGDVCPDWWDAGDDEYFAWLQGSD